MRKSEILLLIAAFSMVAVCYFSFTPTGRAITDITLNTVPKFDGEMTGFSYTRYLDVSERQDIAIEFTNTGTDPYDVMISMYIYYYNGTRLDEEARYFDSYVHLNPGDRRSLYASFKPAYLGDYYIKASVSYSYKKAIVWGYFLFYVRPIEQEIIIITPPAPEAPVITPSSNGTRSMSVEYPKKASLMQGESIIIPVRVKNTGSLSLTNLYLYLSSFGGLGIDVNPKVVGVLLPGTNFTFLATIEANNFTKPGLYPLDLSISTSELKDYGNIEINVSEIPKEKVYDWESLRRTIESYKYILSELESNSFSYSVAGLDTSDINRSIEKAGRLISEAESYYNQRNYDNCLIKLGEAKVALEEASMKLGNLGMRLITPGGEFPLLLLVILIVIIIAIIFLFLKRRGGGERRPRILMHEEGS